MILKRLNGLIESRIFWNPYIENNLKHYLYFLCSNDKYKYFRLDQEKKPKITPVEMNKLVISIMVLI